MMTWAAARGPTPQFCKQPNIILASRSVQLRLLTCINTAPLGAESRPPEAPEGLGLDSAPSSAVQAQLRRRSWQLCSASPFTACAKTRWLTIAGSHGRIPSKNPLMCAPPIRGEDTIRNLKQCAGRPARSRWCKSITVKV
jgi:hypothetical protein